MQNDIRQWIDLLESVQQSLDAVKAEAARLRVELEVWENDDRIDLHWIEREAGSPPGSGAKVMELLCQYADQTGRFILLQVGDEKLAAYYAQFGFDDYDEELDDDFPDWEGDVMIRRPA